MHINHKRSGRRVALTSGACLALLLGPGVASAAPLPADHRHRGDDVTIEVCKEVRGGDNQRFDFDIRERGERWDDDFRLRDGDCKEFDDLKADTEYRVREDVPRDFDVRDIDLSRRCDVTRLNERRGTVTVEVEEGDTCTITFVNEEDDDHHK
jgi:hypothetical protein